MVVIAVMVLVSSIPASINNYEKDKDGEKDKDEKTERSIVPTNNAITNDGE